MAFPRKTALLLVAVAVLVVAWLAAPRPSSGPERELDAPGVDERPEVAPPASAIDEDTRRVARARWEDRRARIQAAHARRAREHAPGASGPSSRDCTEADCSADAAENGGDALFTAFIDETTTLTQGCEELLEGKPVTVRIEARLIGAPDIGTIVESVSVSGAAERVDALTECLTEGMYTLELGDAADPFQRDAVLMHGLLDEVAAEGWLTPDHVVEIRQQMIDGGLDPATDPMVFVGADDPAPTPRAPPE